MDLFEQLRNQAKKIKDEIQQKADSIGLHYVILMWKDPITRWDVNYRVGYFEDNIEAMQFKNALVSTYEELNLRYYVVSDVCDISDGGLFDKESEGVKK